MLQHYKKASQMWNTLQEEFSTKDTDTRQAGFLALIATKQGPQMTVDQYCRNFSKKYSELRQAEGSLLEWVLITLFMAGISSEFETFAQFKLVTGLPNPF
jgi:hypothetical protein